MRFNLSVFATYLAFGAFAIGSGFTTGAHAIAMGVLGAACVIAAAIVQLARAIEDGNRPAEGAPK